MEYLWFKSLYCQCICLHQPEIKLHQPKNTRKPINFSTTYLHGRFMKLVGMFCCYVIRVPILHLIQIWMPNIWRKIILSESKEKFTFRWFDDMEITGSWLNTWIHHLNPAAKFFLTFQPAGRNNPGIKNDPKVHPEKQHKRNSWFLILFQTKEGTIATKEGPT